MESQTGKTALVTGATSGIGRELANLFAKDGYNLILVARSSESLTQIAHEYEEQFGIKATPIARDLMDPKSPEEIYDEVKRSGMEVNVLVNNAGMGEYGMFASETDIHKELGIIQLNVSALVHLSKLFLKDMVQRNEGKILMLGSIASVMPHPLMAVYGATKSFILSFTEALRNELKDTNITVTALMPGATNTDFFHKAGAEGTRAHKLAQETGDPAKVAKDGYDALMKGKDKVVSGMMNKAQVAMSHVLPDQAVSGNMRKLLERPNEAEQEKQDQALLITAVAVGVVAATALLWAFGGDRGNWYDGWNLSRKARAAKDSLFDSLSLN
ncbi:SDR family NAD(P)-dependent oxidoreductase [Larkinella soli]|uniref:SDR family NAD(P)-dependent oxidoreductase n=1 Tax=Larkinella soli TaxID=1770527 RepID=UPI000FFC26AD|nr:SDR family oxidoreductase [Larkinella soli]